jgi:hypothetical protein
MTDWYSKVIVEKLKTRIIDDENLLKIIYINVYMYVHRNLISNLQIIR